MTRNGIDDLTAFAQGDLFTDEQQVRDYFTVENMRSMFSECNLSQIELNQMAEQVIANGWHMVKIINIIAAGEDYTERIGKFTVEIADGTDAELVAIAQLLVAEQGYTVLTDSKGGYCAVDPVEGQQINITVDPDKPVTPRRFTVLFDNSGGVTLRLPDYAHHYNGYVGYIEQAARDLAVYLHNPDTSDWDGNDPAARVDDDTDGYKKYNYVIDILNDTYREIGWLNVIDFAIALRNGIGE